MGQDNIFSEAYSGHRVPFSPIRFLDTWWRSAGGSLAGYQQQDAHEFYLSLLDGLSQHTDRSTTPSVSGSPSPGPRSKSLTPTSEGLPGGPGRAAGALRPCACAPLHLLHARAFSPTSTLKLPQKAPCVPTCLCPWPRLLAVLFNLLTLLQLLHFKASPLTPPTPASRFPKQSPVSPCVPTCTCHPQSRPCLMPCRSLHNLLY